MKNEIKSNQSLHFSQNVPENSKIKVARNDHEKVRTSLQRLYGLPTPPQNINRAIHHRHLQCRWRWSCANQLHFSWNLQMKSKWAKMCLEIRKSKLREMDRARTYRKICVLRRCRKSVGTLRTCPDLPPTISRTFDFRVFGHIFCSFWFHLQLSAEM